MAPQTVLSLELPGGSSTLVDIAGTGHFSFEPCPQSAELRVLVVHSEAELNHRPGFVPLLLLVELQRPSQEALSHARPAQASLHTPDGLGPVELQGPAEVLQRRSLSGTEHHAAASPTQVLCPHLTITPAAAVRCVVFLDDPVQVGYGPLV